ncbi:Serine/threonine-protein kinase [Ceratobasidium sp. AG-Ba]|nr:Serine/threonine-protein kinase [Ceratobasidium sp. AG-Ba]
MDFYRNWRHSRTSSKASLEVPQNTRPRSTRTPSPGPSTAVRPRVQAQAPAFPVPQPHPAPARTAAPVVMQMPDEDAVMEDATKPSSPPTVYQTPSINVPAIHAPAPQPYEKRSSFHSFRSRSPSILFDNEAAALAGLGTQCALSLATVTAELAPIPCIGVLVGCLTVVFQAVEKSRVNREQWKLLKGRCVMVSRIAGAQVTNYGGEHYHGLQQASDLLHDTILNIGERANYWNEMNDILAFVQFQGISDEIKSHFSALDSCLNLFSYATDVAQLQWVGEFNAVQKQELIQLEQMRSLMQEMNMRLDFMAHSQETVKEMTTATHEMLKKVVDDKFEILQNQATTPVAIYANAQQIVQTIRTVTNIQLPSSLLVGRQCILDANVPIRTGVTCDIYSASFLTNEKVAKKVFRIGMSEKEHVERYAKRFLRDAKLWATFKCDYTLPFYGIGMEAFEGDKHFQLYMVSPLMMNFDAVTYLKKHRKNPGMKESIMRIIMDAAKGLQYLHNREPPVVHSGMRGENILISDSGGGVLGGFGLTKALQDCTGTEKIPPAVMTGKTEGQRWMAPEMFIDDNPILQTPSDVWGWAMTALELISGQAPYYHNKQTHTIILDIRLNKRPQRAKYADFDKYALKPDEMWALLEKCWATEPEDRPTIDEVLIALKKMAKK